MKNKKLKYLLYLILGITILTNTKNTCVVNARSSGKETNIGIVSRSEKSLLNLDSLQIDFDYNEKTESKRYDQVETGKAVATYTFTNNTNEEINEELLLPIYGNRYRYIDDSNEYHISIDNEEIETKLRHTFIEYYDTECKFSKDNLKDELIENEYYNSSLKVYKHRYYVSNLMDLRNDAALIVRHDSKKCNVIFANTFISNIDDVEYICSYLTNKEYFDVYFLENDFENIKDVGRVVSMYDASPLDANIQLINKEEMTFDDLVYINYDEHYGVSKLDYYNAILTCISEKNYFTDIYMFNIVDSLLNWRTFNISLKPHKSMQICVDAPVYLTQGYQYNLYSICCPLNFINSWNEPDEIKLTFNTDLFLSTSSLGEFIKDEESGKYELTTSYLPVLFFDLKVSMSENYISDSEIPEIILLFFSEIFLFIKLIVALIIPIVKRKQLKAMGSISLKTKEGFKLKVVELVLIMISSIFILVGMAINDVIPMVIIMSIAIIYLALFVYNIIKNKSKELVRMILFVSIIFYSSYIIISDYSSIAEYIPIALLQFIIFIITIVKIAKIKPSISGDSDNSTSNGKYFMVGIIDDKSNKLVKFWIGLIPALLITSLILSIIVSSYFLLIIPIAIILIFVPIYIYISNTNKEFRIYNNDLNYEKLRESIIDKLDNPRIHPETKNFLLMKLLGVAIITSLDDFVEIKKLIVMPNSKNYMMSYDALEANYLLEYDELCNVCDNLLYKYSSNKIMCKNITNFKMTWKAYFTGVCDKGIDKIAPINTNNNFINGINVFIQIGYYSHNGNIEKVSELKYLFEQKYSCFNVMALELNGENIRVLVKEKLSAK